METNSTGRLTRRSLVGLGAGLIGARAVSSLGQSSAAGRPAAADRPLQGAPIPVAFLIDDHAQMIDFSGPWEVLQDAVVADVPGFKLFTVAPTTDLVRVTGGLSIRPDYSIANAPPARAIVIPAQPGGRDPSLGHAKVAWLRSRYDTTDVLMSVCTGAFLLARTGLLDGLEATTHHQALDEFRNQFPKVKAVPARRFVDNGRLITAGGLTSGIEAALHLVTRFYGDAALPTIASYMEYVPQSWSA